ncbi:MULTISPECIES: Ldh family oxidoreductase [unclassified Raoultella]|uniref:Ldh family oxidoreductase n=1 Tax=unclassified Raoultella TaxID=2627600 RepID=UPI001357F721|nr:MULTISPECIES: Ldh family oxidoreductase [unclassified Raoultella]
MGHYFFNETVTIGFNAMSQWVSEIMQGAGMLKEDADLVADTLVVADARGVYSHGCLRVPLYVERIEKKAVNPKAKPELITECGALALVDGNNAAGQVVSYFAMQKTIELAEKFGIAFVTARNSNHNGAAAYYSMMASAKNMIGICMSIGGGNLMAPYGGAERRIGNNPLSVALPAMNREPVVLDMAQSVVAKGKIMMARKTHSLIPAEWALDSDGMPTTDPFAATEGFLRTMGDYKGSGLSVVIGMLSSMVSQAAIGPSLLDVYEDFRPLNKGHTFIAIKYDALVDPETFRENMDEQISFIKDAKKAKGVSEIYLPGEMESITYAKQSRNGIVMAGEVISELVRLSEKFGVDIPSQDIKNN